MTGVMIENRSVTAALAFLALVAAVRITLVVQGLGDRPTSSPSVTAVLEAASIPEHGSALGDPEAPVTVLDFIDLECGPAATVHRETLPPVIDQMVKTGKARIVLVALAQEGHKSEVARDVFHRMAQKDRAWEWTDLVFRTEKGPENSRSMTPDYIRNFLAQIPGATPADRVGLPDAQVSAVEAQDDELARALGVHGTPSIYVGPTDADAHTYAPVLNGEYVPTASIIISAIEAQARSLEVSG